MRLPFRFACPSFVAGLLLATTCLLPVLRAADVTITLTGTVFEGTDQTGVFGFAPNTDLTGKSFTLVFTFDDTKGTQGSNSTGSYIENTDASNPGTALLQIGDGKGSFGFGTLGFSPYASYASVTEAGSVTNSEFHLSAGDGNYGSNWNDIQGTVSPARGTILTSNPSWEASFTNSNLEVGSQSDNYSLSFGIIETYDNPLLNMIAGGYLTVKSITVSGPTTCSSTNVSLSIPGPQYMQASFTPPSQETVLRYAQNCGFDHLNWQSKITHDDAAPAGFFYDLLPRVEPRNHQLLIASGNVAYAGNKISLSDGDCINDWRSCSLIAPGTFFDPPNGSYTYLPDNPYPFYYPDEVVLGGLTCSIGSACPPLPLILSPQGATLSFVDDPGAWYYSGDPPSSNPTGKFIAFVTTLVGVSSQASAGAVNCAADSALYCTPLYSWQWNSTFNGYAGGIAQTAGFYPIDPGSGTGGVTITSINGVQLPTAISVNQITTTASGLAYSRVSQTFNGTVTLTNTGTGAIIGPLQIVFFGMAANVTLANETANLFGTPFLTVPNLTSLASGQSATVSVQFKNPSNTTINITPVIYSGSIN